MYRITQYTYHITPIKQGVTSVERGHLADWYQNVAKDLNNSQHKFQEHH